MTDASIFPIPASFNPAFVKERDPEFWADWHLWQKATLLERDQREIVWHDLMARRVKTATAVAAKLEVAKDMPADALDRKAHAAGFTYRDILGFDVEALATREVYDK